MASGEPAAAPWHAAYPTPRKTEPAIMSRDELLSLITKINGSVTKYFILIDLRRTDNEGGMIQGSINLPAQSLYPTIPTLYNIFKAAGLRKIIWFCCKTAQMTHPKIAKIPSVLTLMGIAASSRGRGSRAALWFQDFLDDHGDSYMESLILADGIKGWATAGDDFVQWMDGYQADVWPNA
ncbi:hypothetical protein QQS21_011047 [Conoideocrella luteorostrata]|uniref:Rhodanese domain-containing protein n=1 Tax=Conoideocrella luteorostrata TaxID=1105319 RepID=A0AAJ0FNS3_9HYPO|nr:hypothetical protein QQS21_011047 [Conoideocrella luteorostrata]